MTAAARRIERRVSSGSRWIQAERSRLLRLAGATHRSPEPAGHLLLPTVGMGNIGDQAMFEAVIRNVPGPITAVLQAPSSHDVPPDVADRVTTVVLSHLYAGRPDRVRRHRRQLIELIARHSSMGVIGADIMDGGYDRREATTRYAFLAAANRLGLDTRVYGFSWNGRPDEPVVDAVRATQPETRLCVRDPHSLRRIEPLGGAAGWRTVLVTDTVFSLPLPVDRPSVVDAHAAPSERPLAIVNVSGLIMGRSNLLDDHVAVVRELLGLGCDVLLVPHVIRPGDDDAEACRNVGAQFADEPRVRLIGERLTPTAIAQLTRQASVVFTGRMHLAILALSQEVPAVVLTTQGKVSGLLELLALDELILEPRPGFATAAAPLLRRAVSSDELVRTLRGTLPHVRDLSVLNFDGLRVE